VKGRLVGIALAGAGLVVLALRLAPVPWFFALVPAVAFSLVGLVSRRTEAPPRAEPPPYALALTFAAFALAFFLQSARRHWSFGSGALDLGLFFQTHWLMAEGRPAFSSLLGMHAFADHLTLLDPLVAQVLRLRSDADALLLVQALTAASGVFPLAFLGRRYLGGEWAGLALAWLWLLQPDLHCGVMFDYNPNQMASAGLLWTTWALLCRGFGAALAFALLTCLSKENLCLYVATLALVLAFRGAAPKRCAAVIGLALLVFVVDLFVLQPRFGGFRHWDYDDLGSTPREALATAARHPLRTAGLLVSTSEKQQALLQPLAATGFVGARDPVSLVLLLPNWAERLLSSRRTRWWGYHYGSPAAAMALVGVFLAWWRLRQTGRGASRLGAYALSCALLVGTFPPYLTAAGNPRSDLYVWRWRQASAPEDVATQREAVAFVGRDPALRVAAQYYLVPHLAARPYVYGLDGAEEADVVVLQLNGGSSPGGRAGYRARVFRLVDHGGFEVAFCRGQSVVLRRRGRGPAVGCPAFEAFLATRRPGEG
jgi:uncharacterized membrane protein